jgi:carbon monoxide dehydrogenase subunit G
VSQFEIVRVVDLTPAEAWARVTRWESHGSFVPLTTITTTDLGFVARTGLGPVGFDDPMEIVEWDEPSYCKLVKTGRLVRGWAEIEVVPQGTGSRVVWREDISVRGVPRFADPVVKRSSEALFSRVLDGVLARPGR